MHTAITLGAQRSARASAMGSLALFLPRRPAELLMPTPAVKTEALVRSIKHPHQWLSA